MAFAPKRAKPRKGRTYPLTSLMRCGLCGGRMRSLQRAGAKGTTQARKSAAVVMFEAGSGRGTNPGA